MNILIVNDDGIFSEGIHHLAKLAKKLGNVTVVAPLHQCSGMSHRISFENEMLIRKAEIPVEGVDAYSVTGNPADCTRVGMKIMEPMKPDLVLSGINKGYNAGYETWYSGTVAAALEAQVFEVPAFAFSMPNYNDYSALDEHFEELVTNLLKEPIERNQIWNINIPNCSAKELQGIQFDCQVAKMMYYHDAFVLEKLSDRMSRMEAVLASVDTAPEGTDIKALLDNYISVSKLSGIR